MLARLGWGRARHHNSCVLWLPIIFAGHGWAATQRSGSCPCEPKKERCPWNFWGWVAQLVLLTTVDDAQTVTLTRKGRSKTMSQFWFSPIRKRRRRRRRRRRATVWWMWLYKMEVCEFRIVFETILAVHVFEIRRGEHQWSCLYCWAVVSASGNMIAYFYMLSVECRTYISSMIDDIFSTLCRII